MYQICIARKRSLGQSNVLHMCVILFTGGCVSQYAMECTPPWADTPLGRHSLSRHPLGRHSPSRHPLGRHTPHLWADTPHLGRHPLGRYPPPPPRWQLKRAVRILLECILVISVIYFFMKEKNMKTESIDTFFCA